MLSLWRATAFVIDSELPPDEVITRIRRAVPAGGERTLRPGELDVRGHCTADDVNLALNRTPTAQSYHAGWVRLSGRIVPTDPGSTLSGRFRFLLVARVFVPVWFCFGLVLTVLSFVDGIVVLILPLAMLAGGLGVVARIVHRGWREQALLLNWVRWLLSPVGPQREADPT